MSKTPQATNTQSMAACTECRRRKLACSKEQPSCKECRRLSASCVYEVREKPGLKSGAVENLNKRVDKIEQLLQQVQQQTESFHRSYSGSDSSHDWRNVDRSPQASDLLQLFERELTDFRKVRQDQVVASTRDSATPVLQTTGNSKRPASFTSRPQSKRQRCNSGGRFEWGNMVLGSVLNDTTEKQPLAELLDAVVDKYFSQVHPWLPILHEIRFRQVLSEQVYSARVEVILHAMIVSAVRFTRYSNTVLSHSHLSQLTKSSRDWVMLNALNSLSVENLQALSIVAFDDIGKGEPVSAWSIVGSLTRTVEYLQLSTEVEEDWTEMETRRRVFWTIFNLDRFCSVVTGWNTSLTSDDVHRRLPVDGFLWRKQEAVLAPFFGIWDKSAGRIGNPITFLPTQYPSLSQAANEEQQILTRISDFEQNASTERISAIGAFAYCIEATESMSRVTTYFLQQKVNLLDQKQIGRWLTRFKELDLRLVHWKMFLPQKWKDTKICQRAADVIMDPNLTLAHITHNASMILLHQLIAYPPADWDWATRLPSSCSAETCQTAAQETSSITENYLKSPTKTKIVNGQFLFCVFIAARLLLIHWRYYEEQRPIPEFFTLLNSLDTLSNRWQGGSEVDINGQLDLAAKYASLLHRMYEKCIKEPGFRIDVLAYANEMGDSSIGIPVVASADRESITQEKDAEFITTGMNKQQQAEGMTNDVQVRQAEDTAERSEQIASKWSTSQTPKMTCVDSIKEGRTPPVTAIPQAHPSANENSFALGSHSDFPVVPGDAIAIDDLTSISQMLLDQQFLDMDRVISYDEGLFTANMSWWSPGS